MTQEQFDRLLAEAAKEYNQPPEVPREPMWAEIRRQRREGGRRYPSWAWWGVGVAAALLLGVAIGRMELGGADGLPVAVDVGVPESGDAVLVAYQYAAAEHLQRAETFLMLFRADAERGQMSDIDAAPAEDLLLRTRLLLDSPVVEDPALKAVLDDLELVLAQVVQLRTGERRYAEELEYIDQGIEQRGVLWKLRSAIETDPAFAQGESE